MGAADRVLPGFLEGKGGRGETFGGRANTQTLQTLAGGFALKETSLHFDLFIQRGERVLLKKRKEKRDGGRGR